MAVRGTQRRPTRGKATRWVEPMNRSHRVRVMHGVRPRKESLARTWRAAFVNRITVRENAAEFTIVFGSRPPVALTFDQADSSRRESVGALTNRRLKVRVLLRLPNLGRLVTAPQADPCLPYACEALRPTRLGLRGVPREPSRTPRNGNPLEPPPGGARAALKLHAGCSPRSRQRIANQCSPPTAASSPVTSGRKRPSGLMWPNVASCGLLWPPVASHGLRQHPLDVARE